MKVNATYNLTIAVTREFEIDDTELADWIEYQSERDHGYDTSEDAVLAYLNDVDDEFHSWVFRDWRASDPMPKDFEFQGHDVIEVEIPTTAPIPEGSNR